MPREEMLPSESEWMIMETLWRCGHDLTSAEIADALPKSSKMNQRMVRVLINRLCKKGMLTYTVDPDDARVYHYSAANAIIPAIYTAHIHLCSDKKLYHLNMVCTPTLVSK